LVLAGANVFRLNFSHGTHEEHYEVLERIRNVEKELSMPVAILQDLSGPKLRITNIPENFALIKDNDHILIKQGNEQDLSSSDCMYLESLDPVGILKAGERILLADGLIELVMVEKAEGGVRCLIHKGGRIRSRVGIAFPDSLVDLPATTDKDLLDLQWGIKHNVDYVAISFVQSAADLQMVKSEIRAQNGNSRVIPKIERRTALKNIDEILELSDGLMVARGDLGLELPLEQLPRVQMRLIEEANFRGIPVIVATQMLHSMVTSLRPTRAEVSDIATAVMSGADAVMLSEETAIGEHPIEAVKYLGRIALHAEQSFQFEEFKLRLRGSDHSTISDAVAYAAAAAAVKVGASALIACTETGTTARLIAKYRPTQPLYGISSSQTAVRRMCLFWGVIPVCLTEPQSRQEELEASLSQVKEVGNFSAGETAVVTGGLSARQAGSTSVLEIRTMA
jgi:pyruvate kinase